MSIKTPIVAVSVSFIALISLGGCNKAHLTGAAQGATNSHTSQPTPAIDYSKYMNTSPSSSSYSRESCRTVNGRQYCRSYNY